MNMDRDQLMMMMRLMNPELAPILDMMNNQEDQVPARSKKRRTAYQRRYKAAFKKVQKRYKLKSGKWKKGGFRSAVREAHRMAKKSKK
jgi:Mlc titration factor MtfA (ptsG expression regulator)